MQGWREDPLTPLGVLVGLFLVLAAVGTLVTAPWAYSGSTTVSVLRIVGTIGTLAVGVGLVYVAWGAEYLATRRA